MSHPAKVDIKNIYKRNQSEYQLPKKQEFPRNHKPLKVDKWLDLFLMVMLVMVKVSMGAKFQVPRDH